MIKSVLGAVILFAGMVCLTLSPLFGQSAAAPPPEIQTVLFTDGTLLEGKVIQIGGQVQIKTAQGIRSYPQHEIRVIGKNKVDVYDRLSHQIPKDSSSARMALARWCVKENLKPQLLQELKLVLTLHPGNQEAKYLMQEFFGDEKKAEGVVIVELPAKSTRLEFEGKRFESLAGLSPQVAREFTRGVQPILKKKCGAASCHGGNQNPEFHLADTIGAASRRRQSTEENFDEILKLINPDKPKESEIFTISRGYHANLKKPLFGNDRASQIHLQRIYAWIAASRTEIKEIQQQKAEAESSRDATGSVAENGTGKQNSTGLQLQPQQQSMSEKEARIQQVNAETLPGQMQQQVDSLKNEGFNKELVNELINSAEPDQFDPSEFNRRRNK
ncbi:MAG: hypothetical protein R3C11_18485 [Planctomycetaceae bacterium]